jgi:hypothetical protein
MGRLTQKADSAKILYRINVIMENKDMRHYIRLVEDVESMVLGYALKESDMPGRFMTWKSGQASYSKNLRQIFPTVNEAENAKNQRDTYLKQLLKRWTSDTKTPEAAEQASIIKKMIDNPVMIVAISARPVA